jgi:hypothetical protein
LSSAPARYFEHTGSIGSDDFQWEGETSVLAVITDLDGKRSRFCRSMQDDFARKGFFVLVLVLETLA